LRTDKPAVESLGDRMNYLIPRCVANPIPRWPPDVFGLCAALLQSSGAYSTVVDDKPPHGPLPSRRSRVKQISILAKSWRQKAVSSRPLPVKLQKWWKEIIQHRDMPLSELRGRPKCILAALNLLAVADEASCGLGVFFGDTHPSDAYEREAESVLFESGLSAEGATLCKRIAASKARVLPKMHTPQSGLTIRSLSHSLAYVYSPDVHPEWLSAAVDSGHHCFNLLAIPWPMKVEPAQFRPTRKVGLSDTVAPNAYGLFTFESSRGPSIEHVRELINTAEAKVGHVDGVVFPELAMSHGEYNHLAQEFVNEKRFLIAGVGCKAKSPNEAGKNEARMQVVFKWRGPKPLKADFAQKKHHRWKLNKSQILQYGLASNLNPEADWWEHISIENRTLSFVTFRPWLTMSTLICEDLARPDPVTDVLRAVAPNLIIALLCDAPQLMSRWPGRYAGALADDPGSSVLTLTSLGASSLSKPLVGDKDRGRTVALWRDAKRGARELELPEGASALLLNIAVEYQRERTVDGRVGDGPGAYPVLAGWHPIYTKEKVDQND